MNKVRKGTYKHFKGKLYKAIALGKHSKTLEDLVIYKAQYNNPISKIWVRPKKMFLEKVLVEGKLVPRFKYLK